MKKRISAIIFLLITCLSAAVLSGCGNAGKTADTAEDENLIVVGFSQVGAESDWRNANTLSMTEALSPENGYRLIIDDAQQKQERQITAIRNFINQGVDYIVLAPTTETGWDTVLNEAKAAGIPVIIVDRMIETEDKTLFKCWVGSDFRREGEKAVAWMSENLTGPLKIVHLQGNIGSSAQIGRTEMLMNSLEDHEDWSIVFQETGDFTQAKGQELMEEILENNIDFNVIYTENDNMAFGALTALENAGINPGTDITIISFDAGRRALNLMLEGCINFDVECNPLHGPRVQALIEEMEAGMVPSKYTYVEEETFEVGSLTKEMIDARGY
ncbi:MAG: ABC transporter substrate-binding protein [Parasporobacterium sp.]|nr:ABC transporter substrate-binding protein [Parasporobacterium sp.]